MQSLTYREFLEQLPHTTAIEELQRRERLYVEREAELELVEPGLCLFGIKNKATKEYRYKTAASLQDACRSLSWDISDVRALPLDVGVAKTVMPAEIKEILKARNEEKKKERVLETPVKKKREGPTLKQEMLDVFRVNPGATKEIMCLKIFEILKRRTGSEDDAYLKNRSNLSYYFYKREVEKVKP